MKKYNLYLWLAVLVGLFASCSQDENAMLQTNESNRVSLTAELPDDFAQIGTRSVPDAPGGDHKLRCILEVWSDDLSTLIVRQEAAPGGIEDITFNFKLEDPGDYKALLWADYIPSNANAFSTAIAGLSDVDHFADEYYKTNSETGLQAVARIKGEMTNPDCLDAFFACKSFTKPATALNNLSATLARPFTKLTIAEKNSTNFDYCKTVLAKATIPTQINVATGVVSASQETTMWNAAPSGAEITVGGSACKTLFSTYILATADGTMQNITLEFTATPSKTLKNVTIPAGVPAKRNYRVNAAGNLIQVEDVPSSDTKMTVDINADWATPDVEEDATPNVWDGKSTAEPTGYTDIAGTVDITSAAELAWLAQKCNDGTSFEDYTFNLTTDIDLNNKPWTPIGNFTNRFKGNFNGQGHTVRNMEVDIEVGVAIAAAGFIGYMEGNNNLIKVSNLIVEGNVNVACTAGTSRAGGICGAALYVNIEFCRFNGTVSGVATMAAECGGIVGNYGGNTKHSLTCCISDATVTASGQQPGSSLRGGLIGNLNNGPVTYSAWNSSRIEEGVDFNMSNSFDETNKPFTDIAELNGLLGKMNESKSDREYEWKEGANANAYPILVRNDNN